MGNINRFIVLNVFTPDSSQRVSGGYFISSGFLMSRKEYLSYPPIFRSARTAPPIDTANDAGNAFYHLDYTDIRSLYQTVIDGVEVE
jgi:hypothetical protein